MASLSCGYKCLQFMLVILNIAVLIFGIGLIVVGSVAESNFKKYSKTADPHLHGFVVFILTFGCFLALLGIYGFCGACKKNVCCLKLYIILLCIFIAAGIAAGIAGFVMRNKVEEYIRKGVDQLYQEYDTMKDSKRLIDTIQRELKCCGPQGHWTGTGQPPDSCKHEGMLWEQGCIPAISQFFKKYMLAVALCVFLFALLQILGMVFAICVMQAVQRGEAC